MGCKLSVSVIHPESIVNKIKETMSPTSKSDRKLSNPKMKLSEERPSSPESKPAVLDSPDSSDSYKTIYVDSP